VRCVESAVRCGGIRVVLNALLDGQHSLSESLVLTLLYLLDAPQTRYYLRPGVDVEVIITILIVIIKIINCIDLI
jgi:hypothetical protein